MNLYLARKRLKQLGVALETPTLGCILVFWCSSTTGTPVTSNSTPARMNAARVNIDIEAALTNAAGLIINRVGGVAAAIALSPGSNQLRRGVDYVIENAQKP